MGVELLVNGAKKSFEAVIAEFQVSGGLRLQSLPVPWGGKQWADFHPRDRGSFQGPVPYGQRSESRKRISLSIAHGA